MLTDEIRRLVRDVRLGFAATVCPDGTPNVSPKGTTLVYDDEHLVFADIRSPQTVANLRENPAIEVNVVDVGTRRGYRFKGTGRIVEADEELLRWYAGQGFELEGRADRFVLVRVERVEELTSPAYDWGMTEEQLVRIHARHYAEVWARRLPDVWPPEIYELHYLADGDAYRGSGHSGDAASWEAGRRPIADAIHRPGTFLDVGCANGLLMESIAGWAAFPVEPYGVDFAPQLVAQAQRRLPQWADRLFVGDALTWEPPRRFDFVRTELVYVAGERRREYVARLLERFLAPGGRLLVCGYGGEEVLGPLKEWGYEPVYEREWSSSSGNRVQLAAIGLPGSAARR